VYEITKKRCDIIVYFCEQIRVTACVRGKWLFNLEMSPMERKSNFCIAEVKAEKLRSLSVSSAGLGPLIRFACITHSSDQIAAVRASANLRGNR
jgi:hypothetical protein